MYFTQEPKTRREDFFNMDEALHDFQRFVRSSKLTLVTGLRRYGKTSLILTGLNEMGERYLFLDCRLLPSGMISVKDFLNLVLSSLRRHSRWKRVLNRVEEVSVAGIRLKAREAYETVLDLLESLEGGVLVLDEAQELRRSRHRFDRLLAYVYDHLNLRVVVSGSQVGVLYKFLRLEDPEAPLYGRPYAEVRVPRLSRQQSLDFLREGFAQHSMKVDERILELAVAKFDGVIGWLSFFGFRAVIRGVVNEETVNEVLEVASRMALSEFKHSVRGKRYEEAMRLISLLGRARWSEVKRGLESKLGRIPDKSLAKLLRNLVDMGFLSKLDGEYEIPDPILRHAFRNIR